MPCVNAERTSVLLFFYCLQCLWLSLPEWLFEDSLKTNVSPLAAACWLGQRVRKVLMFQMPAPTWISYFCTGVSVGGSGIVWGQQLLGLANTKPSPHSDTQYSRVFFFIGDSDQSSNCWDQPHLGHRLWTLVTAPHRGQALREWVWFALGWHKYSSAAGRHLDRNAWSTSSAEHMGRGLDCVCKVQYCREPDDTQCLEGAYQQCFPT